MIQSSWDQTRARSQYHFDTGRIDPRWDTVIGLGKFSGDWRQEIEEAIARARPATWETRGYKGQGNDIPPSDLEAEEYDLERVGANPKMIISHLDWTVPPVFQKISDLFAMQDTMIRVHVQMPGDIWNLHIDKLEKWCPENPDRVMRIMVQLTDWQPGQFWEYGNYHWNHWRAGDVTTFDWINVPHCTANAGHHPRCTLQITGIRTNATEEFLRNFKTKDSWAV